jgi:hypothetical protein
MGGLLTRVQQSKRGAATQAESKAHPLYSRVCSFEPLQLRVLPF